MFAHSTGDKKAPNFGAYDLLMYKGTYPTGVGHASNEPKRSRACA